MTSIRGISDKMWGGQTPGAHILDFTEDAVVLRLRTPSGEIQEIGRAELEAEDFLAQIDALRVEALVQDPSRRAVVLWLPATQVLEKKYVLSSTARGPARAEAMRRLQAETGYPSEELTLDIAPGQPGEASTVLATQCQTVREARDYAERWGFVPGQVSTEAAGHSFQSGDANFCLPASRAYSTGRKLAQAAAVTAIIVGGGFAGLKVYEVSSPLVKAITLKEVPGHLPMSSVQPDMRAEMSRKSTPVVRFSLQSMPLQRLAAYQAAALGDSRLARPLGPISTAHPGSLANPADDVPIFLGAEARLPEHNRPGRLGNVRVGIAQAGIKNAKRAVDLIRRDTRALAVAGTSGQRPKFERAGEVAVVSNVAVAPVQALQANVGAAVLEDAKPTRRSEGTDVREQPAPTGAAASLVPQGEIKPSGPQPEQQEFASIDPASVALPAPRPAQKPAAEQSEATAPAPQSDVIAVKPADADASEAPAAPEPAQVVTPSVPLEQPATIVPDPEEKFAALTSPAPTQRPERLRAADPVLPKKTKAISISRSPTRVGSAANERGLELGETNLIGVIEASNGRKALVRLPDGDFRKVARGDDVNGWRVNSIERAAMRLSRQGQNRTLLLVSR